MLSLSCLVIRDDKRLYPKACLNFPNGSNLRKDVFFVSPLCRSSFNLQVYGTTISQCVVLWRLTEQRKVKITLQNEAIISEVGGQGER